MKRSKRDHMALIPILIVLIPIASSYHICDSNLQSSLYVGIPETKPCLVPPEKEHIKATIQLFIPQLKREEVYGYSCILINTTYFNKESLFGQGTQFRRYHSVDVDECRRWIVEKKARNQTLELKEKDLWMTNPDKNYGFQIFGSYYNVTTYVLQRGMVGTIDGKTVTSGLGDLAGCPLTQGYCIRSGYTIYWYSKPLINRCFHEEAKKEYDVILDENFVLIGELNMALSFADGASNDYAEQCCGHGAKQMDSGMIIRILEEPKRFKREFDPKHYSKDANLFDRSTDNFTDFAPHSLELNARLNMLYYKMHKFMLGEFDKIWFQICYVYNQQVELTRAMMRLDATMGARLWFNRQDITARLAGEVLEVAACSEVVVKQVYKDHKINEECYEYLPVKLADDTIMFAIPGSQDLTHTSPRMNCTTRIYPVYKNAKGLYVNSVGEVVDVSTVDKDKEDYKRFRKFDLKMKSGTIYPSQKVLNTLEPLGNQLDKLKHLEMMAEKRSKGDKDGENIENPETPAEDDNVTLHLPPILVEDEKPKVAYGLVNNWIMTHWVEITWFTIVATIILVISVLALYRANCLHTDYKHFIENMNNLAMLNPTMQFDKTELKIVTEAIYAQEKRTPAEEIYVAPESVYSLISEISVKPVVKIKVNHGIFRAIMDVQSPISFCGISVLRNTGSKLGEHRSLPAVTHKKNLVSFMGRFKPNVKLGNQTKRVRLQP
ncbi:hypothetical protein L596_009398 [Steinernema carpocapsae]|uniref:Uncharacterized protein n=1 Tax=Steinernema carpocapsae TaxID=34508 RepID=A0A4U5PFI9_STECR|nr:hypothetical protein L596_009398 [Steinernema carpocapsae]